MKKSKTNFKFKCFEDEDNENKFGPNLNDL
jgi:hypothetical protein